MAAFADIFDAHLDYTPGGDLEPFLKQAPAKWVVYLFADEQDQPVQLLCVKNLRASLKRRLGGTEVIGPSRKVNYRDLVRRVYWRRVDSGFEADLVYLEAARRVFPRSYRGMLGFELPFFVHVDPSQSFPRYVKTTSLDKDGILIGPFEDKHAAGRFIELVEDAFDLCRYYNVLTQAPRGRACAYKEMGKCPAPCDGTISMGQYRILVQLSAEIAVDPREYSDGQRERMTEAAQDLNFEAAAKIKQYVDQLGQFAKGPFRHARRLEDFRYLSLQHGPHPGQAKAFLVTPGRIEEVAGLIGEPARASEFLRQALERGATMPPDISEQGAERIGVVSDHLFRARRVSGVFVRLAELEERSLARAYQDLQKQKAASAEETEDEGVVKELQQI